MGIFQTLRELGQLPLASVGKGGELTEIVDGMGPDGCPWVYDSMTGTVVQQERCPPRDGLLESERCDPKADAWCRPGAVVSMRRRKGGPVILPYTALSLMNVWSHLYSSMTEDVRDITTLQGACFRDLVIGKSSTLNFYQAINSTEPDQRALEMFPRIDNLASRVEAMAVFKAFVTSAQREWVEAGVEKTGQRWQGYASEAMERLRRGVGPEDLDTGVLDGLKVTAVPGMLREEIVELKKLYNKRAQASLRAAAQFQKLYGTAAEWRRKAEKEGLLDEEWDYYDDDEAIAALELKKLAAAKKSGASGGERGHERIGNASDRKGERRARTLLSSAYALKAPIGKNVSASNGIAVEAPGRTVLSRAGGTPRWFDKSAVFRHETPRPVVTYMSRNFFSRGVLNERDLLEYVLTRYNVTLRVTTFEEPLLEVMEMLGSSDVMFGMHGAGWTNALFIKRGATTMQMFPYGWRLPDGSTVRGFNYREIVYASECPYQEWVSQSREHAFFRRIDYRKKPDLTYSLHPDPSWPLPSNSWPGNPWIYQNTYVDMDDFGPALDAMMKKAGIAPMPGLRRGDELGSERID